MASEAIESKIFPMLKLMMVALGEGIGSVSSLYKIPEKSTNWMMKAVKMM